MICRIELQPLLDELIFIEGLDREEGYRKTFAQLCGCPEAEIVDIRFEALHLNGKVYPIVRAAWEGQL
jgi:hypothetical protein